MLISSAGHIMQMIASLKANSRRRGPSYLKRDNATLGPQIFEESFLNGDFTAQEKMKFYRRIHRIEKRNQIARIVLWILGAIGLFFFSYVVFD